MTRKTSLWPLQQMLFERLSNDGPLNQVITKVRDEVSASAIKPYVVIGEPNVSPFDTKTSAGENIVLTIHTWDDSTDDTAGKKRSYEILNLILQALSKSPLTVDGFTLFRVELVSMRVITDIFEESYHGIMELRFYINN